MFWWIVLIIVGVLLLLHWGIRNAVWGTATTSSSNPVAVACSAFDLANEAYDVALSAITPYSFRAKHRHAILIAEHALTKEPATEHAITAYDQAVAACSDPGDCAPYTVASLDAHTAAIDYLTIALDIVTDAFTVFNTGLSDAGVDIKSARKLYVAAAAVYKSDCDLFTLAAEAYSKAADCAMIDACAGKVQDVRNQFQLMLLETGASNAAVADASDARAKAATFKTKATEEANRIELLKHQASMAKEKTEQLLGKAYAFLGLAKRATTTDVDHHSRQE